MPASSCLLPLLVTVRTPPVGLGPVSTQAPTTNGILSAAQLVNGKAGRLDEARYDDPPLGHAAAVIIDPVTDEQPSEEFG